MIGIVERRLIRSASVSGSGPASRSHSHSRSTSGRSHSHHQAYRRISITLQPFNAGAPATGPANQIDLAHASLRAMAERTNLLRSVRIWAGLPYQSTLTLR